MAKRKQVESKIDYFSFLFLIKIIYSLLWFYLVGVFFFFFSVEGFYNIFRFIIEHRANRILVYAESLLGVTRQFTIFSLLANSEFPLVVSSSFPVILSLQCLRYAKSGRNRLNQINSIVNFLFLSFNFYFQFFESLIDESRNPKTLLRLFSIFRSLLIILNFY